MNTSSYPSLYLKYSLKFNMESSIRYAIFIALIISLFSCSNSTNDNNSQATISAISGTCILRPLENVTALAMASSKAKIFIDFIDSSYCNIDIKSNAGNITLSRKYKIENDKIGFTDPLSGVIITYDIVSYKPELETFHLAQGGIELFTALPYDNSIKDIIYSDNSLKRNEFLYPTLTEQESEFGIEQMVTDKNGRIIMVKSPIADEVSKIDIYKLF